MSGINPVYSGAANVAARLGSGVNIHEMVQLMQLERHGLLEKEMTGQLDEMKKRNAWLQDAGAQLAKLRAMYEPYVQATGRNLMLTPPLWTHAEKVRDNWQAGPWDRLIQARGLAILGQKSQVARPTGVDADHF